MPYCHAPGLLFAAIFILLQASASAGTDSSSTKMVFSRANYQKGYSHLYVIDLPAGKARRLTVKGWNLNPKFAPNGERIVFESSGRKDHSHSEIYIVNADGTNERRLTRSTQGSSENPLWSGSGEGIHYTLKSSAGVLENYISLKSGIVTSRISTLETVSSDMTTTSSDAPLVNKERERELQELKKTVGSQFRGSFDKYTAIPSPDDQQSILYYQAEGRLVLRDNSTKMRKTIKEFGAGPASWNRNSTEIAFSSGDPGDQFLVLYDIQTNNYRQTKFDKGDDIGCGEPAWSRDAKYIFYSCGTPYSETDDSWTFVIDLQTLVSTRIVQGNSPDVY